MTDTAASAGLVPFAGEDPAARALAALAATQKLPKRPVGPAMRRGFLNRCPNCGEGPLIRGYLKVNDACPSCGEDLSHQRADDAPPYLTMVIVGHIVVPLMLLAWTLTSLPPWVHYATWIPLTLLMTLGLLRPIKGAVVGLQWANRMHGFGEEVPVPGMAVRVAD
jgi:uncharacterized protein (DUF983 family)